MSDHRLIVYGVHCVWWDSIENASAYPNGLPCCPHCGSMLRQVEESKWWEGADRYEADGSPGYCARLKWARGKCFKSMDEQKRAYQLHQHLERIGEDVPTLEEHMQRLQDRHPNTETKGAPR
ncbi:MAG: hypothetical protein ABFS86_16400 [Planctomycetota bacterium]